MIAPLVVVRAEDVDYFPLQLPGLKLFAWTKSDLQQRITVLISFQLFFRAYFFPLKDYPGFQLNQSCLWLEIMSVLAGLQMNTVALGLLEPGAVASCRQFCGRQKKEILAFRDQLKTHIQIEGAQ